ncbi:UNVERIFIED_ORG: transposase [Kosakonia oryzae]|uniref:Transposase n=1 Tax=Kosakonia radicincitans TaxID=283686 RepID=A0AAX2ENR9_9ENTR|nr:hypothetical protein [Kosakonia radicincitans]MDP9567200.1 transposase [Kosakonia oryzae]SFE70016.1 hypothetical protein SAMN03159468_02477 [Kosakonia radicincitans]SFR02620.1 hypothetical protein SAMN03159514_01014 [Kosakonia radicincitans]SFT60487.1 hypothetical protein SAMN03159428_01330 [Kosakonia radicincitans]SFX29113.1 hypothetical protein SAMN03159436_01011 [Kosakonia radicincitans]
MNAIKVISIDLVKSVFQICVWMNDGIAFTCKVSRAKLLDCILQFPAGLIVGMEACATSRSWGTLFKQWAFRPTYPHPARKSIDASPKKDANDAPVTCETACQ